MSVDTFPNSRIRHGTYSGWSRHKQKGTTPCDACARAKAEYDRHRREMPEQKLAASRRSLAQQRAYRRTAHLNPETFQAYQRLYREELARLESVDAALRGRAS